MYLLGTNRRALLARRALVSLLAALALTIGAWPAAAQTALDAGQRQTREQAAPTVAPLARLDNRLQNRITSRVGLRIERSDGGRPDEARPFSRALDSSRVQPRATR